MKSFLQLALKRRTTYEFSRKKVPAEIIRKVLEAGRWAPSVMNSQPWQFIVVRDEKTIREIMRASYYGLFHTAPNAIIIVALLPSMVSDKLHRGMINGKLGRDESLLCASMPILMMDLACADMGIGSCILSLDETRLPKSLGIAKGQRAPLGLGMGYEERGARETGQTHCRKPLAELLKDGRL
ncbi:MAG: nitroreductase family protein [Candidatus Micrarchaeota archaeon]|nr:nitroreductase family protein [Candidatus Micrarchaeota archaeon]